MDMDEARAQAERLLVTAVGSAPPTAEQRETVEALKEAYVIATAAVFALVPVGRRRSLALTHLEESLMMAIKAVFND